VNRTHFQRLARGRLRDAEVLLAAGQWSGAYYLAGYAAECGLKACVAKLTKRHDFPDKDRALRSYTHNLELLVRVAGITDLRDADASANPALSANWVIAKDWNEEARYDEWTEPQARKLFEAVFDLKNGVFPWITDHW